MTKKEQLKEVFTKELLLMLDERNIKFGLLSTFKKTVEDTVNTLLKEVTIRFK